MVNDVRLAPPAPSAGRRVPVDEVMQRIGLGAFHSRLILVCGLGFSAAAMEVVLSAFLFPELRRAWDLGEFELGALPGIVGIGSTVGQVFWGIRADSHGRRPVFTLTVIVVVLAGIASGFSNNLTMLYITRFLVGFGYGGNIAVDLTLFSEMMPTSGRGGMLFGMAFFWPLGQVLTCALAWLLIPSLGWRFFVMACALPSLVTALFRPLIPESPRWLLLQGRAEEATEALRHMAEVNGKSPAEVGLGGGARVCLGGESELLAPGPSQARGPRAMLPLQLFSPELWKTSLAALILLFGLGNANYGILTFMPSFLEMKGMEAHGVYVSMLFESFSQVPGILLATWAGTTIGRKLPLQCSMFFVGLSLTFFGLARTPSMMILCSCVAAAALEFCWALFHVYIPEVYPTEVRASASGCISAAGHLCATCVPIICASLLVNLGYRGVIMFLVIVSFSTGALMILLLHTETKDRDLQDVASGPAEPQDSARRKKAGP